MSGWPGVSTRLLLADVTFGLAAGQPCPCDVSNIADDDNAACLCVVDGSPECFLPCSLLLGGIAVAGARTGGWLAVIGRAASPSEKIARVNIVAQVRDEVKRRGRIKSLEIKPESSAQAALHCSLCPADADCNGGTFRPLPRVGYGQNKAPYALNIRGPEIRTRVLSRGRV